MAKAAAKLVVKLSSGSKMPLLGFGTFQMTEAAQLRNALKTAVIAGYRHIDTAFAHKNEHLIGEILQKDVFDKDLVKREDLFITTKLPSTFHERTNVRQALKIQLKALRLQYVDLYLIDSPFPTSKDGKTGRVVPDKKVKLEDTWAGMEDCVRSGLVRSIGLSNCNAKHLIRVMDNSLIRPAVNQIEIHPRLQNVGLAQFCKESNIYPMAYAPFGSAAPMSPMTGKVANDLKLLENDVLIQIGNKYKKLPAQVILRWLIQREIAVVVKSVRPERIVSNFKINDFELNASEMALIEKLDANKHVVEQPAEPDQA